jgi:hypothetical protein
MKTMRARSFFYILTLLLSGCATSPQSTRAEVRSQVDEALMPRMVNRLAVVNHLARAEEAWSEDFSRHMRGYLAHYGVAGLVQTRSPLEVESDKRAFAAELREFQPVAVLVVEPGQGVVGPGGEHREHTFEAGLIPYPPAEDGVRRVVWKARVNLRASGPEIGDADLKELAAVLLRALIDDGVLPPPGLMKPPKTGP